MQCFPRENPSETTEGGYWFSIEMEKQYSHVDGSKFLMRDLFEMPDLREDGCDSDSRGHFLKGHL